MHAWWGGMRRDGEVWGETRNASTVGMPLTSENFRSDKYSASDWESGT